MIFPLICLAGLIWLNLSLVKEVRRRDFSPHQQRLFILAIWLFPVIGAVVAGVNLNAAPPTESADEPTDPAAALEPPNDIQLDGAEPFNCIEHLTQSNGVPLLDWPAVLAWTTAIADPDLRRQAEIAAKEAWLLHLCAALGGPYYVYRLDRAWVLSTLERKLAETAAVYINACHRKIQRVLAGVADTDASRRHMLLVLDDDETYYHFLDNVGGGESQVASAGVFCPTVMGGFFVTRKADLLQTEPIIAHEMTHAAVNHLQLPLWLDEGLAMNTEARITGAVHRYTEERHRSHQRAWNAQTIQWFWFGHAFHQPEMVTQAYDLARILVEQLAGDWQRFAQFLHQAQRDDGGAAAAATVLGIDLPRYVCEILGADYSDAWVPRPEQLADLAAFQQQLVGATDLLSGTAAFDPAALTLAVTLDGQPQVMPCESLYAGWVAQTAVQRPAWLADALAHLLAAPAALPSTLDPVRDQIFPVLANACQVSHRRLQQRAQGKAVAEPQAWLGDLVLQWVLRDHDQWRPVPDAVIAEWGIERTALMQLALDNLQRESGHPQWRDIGTGVYLANGQDGLDTSRVLVPDCLRLLDLVGDPVVMMPTADKLLVTGARNNAGLMDMVQMLQGASFEQTLSDHAYVLDGHDWHEFTLPFELQALMQHHHRVGLIAEYQKQQPLLEHYLKSIGDTADVAGVETFAADDGVEIVTRTRWNDGQSVWLPQVDQVILEKRSYAGRRAITVTWAALIQQCGLEPVAGLAPERYRASHFPDAATWDRLSAVAVGVPRSYV